MYSNLHDDSVGGVGTKIKTRFCVANVPFPRFGTVNIMNTLEDGEFYSFTSFPDTS